MRKQLPTLVEVNLTETALLAFPNYVCLGRVGNEFGWMSRCEAEEIMLTRDNLLDAADYMFGQTAGNLDQKEFRFTIDHRYAICLTYTIDC